MIFDRELCSKVLKEALLLFLLFLLLEAWNHEQKMLQIEQKMLQKEQKMFATKSASNWAESREFKVTKLLLYAFTAICGLVGPNMALNDLSWSWMAFYIIVLPCIFFTASYAKRS